MTGSPTTNFWKSLDMLARRRSLVITMVMLAMIGSIAVSLWLPSWYSSEVLLLPPKEISMPVTGTAQMAELVSMTQGLDLPLMVTVTHVYSRVLKSRNISYKIIEQFDLRNRYKADNMTETYLALMEHTIFEVTPEGLLSITVEDKEATTAAEMANAYIEQIDRLNQDIVRQRAKKNREFLKSRLITVTKELENSRQNLEDFQLANKAINFTEQTRLLIDQAIALKVSLSALDIEIEMGQELMRPDNPELLEKTRRREIIRSKLSDLETGTDDSSFFAVPISALPGLQGEYQDLYSRVRVNERLYRLLLEQNEQARINEAELTPVVSVLDSARPAEIRSRPQRTKIVAISVALATILAIFLAALIDYLARLKQSNVEDYNRLMRFLSAFLGWLPGISQRKQADRQV